MSKYFVLNYRDMSLNLKGVKVVEADDSEAIYKFVCSGCGSDISRKAWCEQEQKITTAVKKNLVEITDKETIEIHEETDRINPLALSDYYYLMPTILKGSKLVLDKDGKNIQYWNFVGELQKILVGIAKFGRERKICIFRVGNALVMAKINQVKAVEMPVQKQKLLAKPIEIKV